MDSPDEDLTAVFNRLSAGDQRKLKIASTTNTVIDDACADSVRHPWKYPFYALYILAMMLPTPGIRTVVMMGVLVGWANMGLTKGARDLKEQLGKAREPASLMKNFAECVAADEKGKPVVRLGAVFKNVFSHGWHELAGATRRIFAPKPPEGPGAGVASP